MRALTAMLGAFLSITTACAVQPAGPEETNPATTGRALGKESAAICRSGVTYWGGPTMHIPRVYHLYWGYQWDWLAGDGVHKDRRTAENKAWTQIANDQGFWLPMQEYAGTSLYGAWDGEGVGWWDISNTSVVSDDDIKTHLAGEATIDGSERIYVIYLPNGVQSQHDISATPQAAAHHGSFLDPNGSGTRIYYVVMENYANDYVESHELMESVSDPALSSWWSISGQEIGDLCQKAAAYSFNGYALQPMWSNAACGCVPATPLNPLPMPTPPSGTPSFGSGAGGGGCVGAGCPSHSPHQKMSTGPFLGNMN